MNEASKGKSLVLFRATSLMAAIVLYILSIGPAALLAKGSSRGDRAARIIYAPVIWLHENTFLAEPLEAYVAWWGV